MSRNRRNSNNLNGNQPPQIILSETAIPEYLEIVKSEYIIERDKKQSFENRSGILLALLSALSIFIFEKIKINDIIVLFNLPLTFLTLLKILLGLLIYLFFCSSFLAIIKTIAAKKHDNFEVKNINESLLLENRKDALARLILTYRDIIVQHRAINEKRSKWYIASLYSVFVTLISTIIYISI